MRKKNLNYNNPVATQRYSADPGVMTYNDTVYVYSTNDIYEYGEGGEILENRYGRITTINCFSTKDFANWTDHGAIQVAGKQNPEGVAKWANNSWAPCAAHKTINGKEKFFLYFADNGSGIGVLTSDSPEGPWVDPLGKQLISRQTPTCAEVTWLFDPAVMVDDDGTGYLYFGGGVPEGKAADPGTARVAKLGDDMISIVGDPVVINPPYLFEDSGITKINNKYYYSYCSNFSTEGSDFHMGTIQAMVSDNPMGPFTYDGEIFLNPIVFFNDGNGNNHHTLFEFKGDLYMAYHCRTLELATLGENHGYRATHIDRVEYKDGKISPITATMEGIEQLMPLNPYETQRATTMAAEEGIEVVGLGYTTLAAKADAQVALKGVEFSKGAVKIEMTVAVKDNCDIDVVIDEEVVATVKATATNGEFKTFEAPMKNVTGVKNLFFNFKGEALVKDWRIS